MSLFSELKRRNVFRVGLAYLIGGWVVIQVADTVLDNIGAPAWVIQTILLIVALGFVAALFFSWAFEVTPEGLKRESEVDRSQSITGMTGRKLDRSITVLLVLALAYFVWESRVSDRAPAVDAVTEEIAEEVAATVSDKSIAVLPFDNRSSREEDEYFTEGIHDDLLTTIAKIGSMKVISRTSVMEYKDTTKNIRDIAKELGVANILEGGVQRSGNQVRINVQLIDAVTDEHLWAEIYDRELTAENLFSIQSEISKAIAEALQATLSPEEQQKIEAIHTQNLAAYESYLLGRKFWTARTAESNAKSVKHFQHAIDLDPAYALAYVGLSDAYRHSVFYEGVDPGEAYPLAERAVQTALQINDQIGEAYASLGALKRQYRDIAGAEVDFRRAIEISPNHLPSYNWYALTLSDQGRYEEGLELFRKGLELDPLSAVIRSNMGFFLMALGRFDEARRTYERSIEMHPDSNFAYQGYAVYELGVSGRADEAALWQSKSLEVDATHAGAMATMALIYMTLDDLDTAGLWLDRSLAVQPDNGVQKTIRVRLLIMQDRLDEAVELANEVYDYNVASLSFEGVALAVLRDKDIAAGRPDDALQRYAKIYPEIVNADIPNVNHANFYTVADIAYLLDKAGEKKRARQLLEAVMPVIDLAPILGIAGTWWGNAQSYALLGRKEEALAELQRGVDAGWRVVWNYMFDYDPIFASLRGEPEFAAMRATIAADMVRQLVHVRELEASGEIMRP